MGLDSGITDFKRPRLNLVVLLDISGSMSCNFNTYYYDAASGRQRELSPEGEAARRASRRLRAAGLDSAQGPRTRPSRHCARVHGSPGLGHAPRAESCLCAACAAPP